MNLPFLAAAAEATTSTWAGLAGAELPWLDALRRSEFEALQRDGLPTTRDEAWKYTALRALGQRRYEVGDGTATQRPVDASAFELPGHAGPRLVFVHGVFRADLSMLDDLPAGLQLQPLARALRADPEPLRFALSRGTSVRQDAFVRLNAAFAADGVLLKVAAGTRLATPVHVVHIGAGSDKPLAWHARSLIEVGEGAALSLIEQHVAAGPSANLGTVVTDIGVHEGAQLDWLMLQDAASESVLMRRNTLRLDADAKACVHALERGGSLVRHELMAELRGRGARLETRGAFLPMTRQHMDTYLDIRHAARGTTSDAMWRGIADQRGRGAFTGRIVVDPGADGTDANLDNKNLLLSPNAEIDTRPVLEIYADEVKAAHGATVGQLDERALFYLRSRGISLDEARHMLTTAFCRAVLGSIANDTLRARAEALLASVVEP